MSEIRTLDTHIWEKVYKDMLNGTNLYRKMLGLSQLQQNNILDDTSKEFSELLSKLGMLDHNPCPKYDTEERFKTVVFRMPFKINSWSENLHINTEIGEYSGILALNYWQLSDQHNQGLKDKITTHIGFGHAIAKYFDINYDIDGIYITQQFVGTGELVMVKYIIELNSDISDHLVDYIYLFSYNFHNLINGYVSFETPFYGDIKLDPLLNMISTQYLLLTIRNEISSIQIKNKIVNLTLKQFPNSSEISPIIVLSPLYIPPARLALKLEGIPKYIREMIKKRKFNKFGMNVALFDNKTFCAAIIFLKDN